MCFGGRELDAVFLKNKAVTVIELKNYGGRVHFSENGDWTADETVVRGGNQENPFRQVRANKFALLDYLREREEKFTEGVIRPAWGHISGAVVFGQPISFDKTLPTQISPWFHICDLNGAAGKLFDLRSRQLVLGDEELRRLIGLLELGAKHAYGPGSMDGVLDLPTTPARMQIVHHKQSEFRAAFLKMQDGGAARTAGAVRLLELIRQASSGLDVFAELPAEGDGRIEHCQIYRINVAAKLVTVRNGDTLRLCFFGDGLDVERWLAANAGLTFAISGTDAKIESTLINSDAPMPPASVTSENLPYLQRVDGLELEELVPTTFIRKGLLRLDENCADQEIDEILEAVMGDDLRSFLRDVLRLTRNGDIAGANARVALRQGQACPVEDAPALAAEALTSGANSEEIVVLNELHPGELTRLLDPKRFQDWMLFLHPDQRKVVEADYDRPVVLTGVSGSGKTCILVHRARHLARKYPGERIGVLTLNRSLAVLLRNLIRELCLDGEDANIHVMAFYDYFSDLLHELGPTTYLDQLLKLVPDGAAMRGVIANVNRRNLAREFDPRSGESIEDWDDFYDQQNLDFNNWLRDLSKHLEEYRIDTSRYLREEFTLIRSAFSVAERDDGYLAFNRTGRSIALPDDLRRDVLRLLLYYEEWMLHGELLDVPELAQAVLPLWREIRDLPSEKKFRCLLVDEFQDFSTQDLRLLMWVPPRDKENALFLAGDPVQKIMVKRLSLTDARLEKGSAVRLQIRKNYRNSRQILKAASQLANEYGRQAATQGEDVEVLDPELAARNTTPPIALKTSNAIRKAWELALECLDGRYKEAWTICLATAAPAAVSVAGILAQKPARISAKALSGDCINEPDTMVVGDIHDLKGFEFNVVIILGCDHSSFPGPGVPKDERWRDALRLYVAMTRARDQVFLFYSGEPSEFLLRMKDQILWQEGEIRLDYEVCPATSQDGRKRTDLTVEARKKIEGLCDVPPDAPCESWFDQRELDTLNRYFAKFVFQKRVRTRLLSGNG